MTRDDFTREQIPTRFDDATPPLPYEVRDRRVYFRGADPWPKSYWTHNGKVFWREYPMRGADAASLRFFEGGFARDHKHCYIHHSRLKGGNGPSFRALNNTYATDGQFVWTIGGKLKDVDAGSFVVCDDGVEADSYQTNGFLIPFGFGKDRSRVYHYDYDGTPNWLRKASAASFESCNDGYFGRDEQFVFWSVYTLPKVDVASWQKLRHNYSHDQYRVYHRSSAIPQADRATFEVVSTRSWIPLARDRERFYFGGGVVDQAEFEQHLAQ